MPYRDDDNDTLDPREFPEPDLRDDAPLPCPVCLGVVHDEAVRCPHCGEWLGNEAHASRKPWWVLVGVAACLVVSIYWIFAG